MRQTANLFRQQSGFSLTELMIALVLGLFVLGGALGVFVSNQNTYRVNTALIQVQNNIRSAFQLMGKDFRSAGFLGCNNAIRVSTVLGDPAPIWAIWNGGIQGDDNPGAINGLNPIAGTATVRMMYASGQSNTLVAHNSATSTMTLNDEPNLQTGDIGIVCDDGLSSIFEVTGTGGAPFSVSHDATGLNCTANLGFINPFNCNAAPERAFPANAMLMRFESVAWFIAPSEDNADVMALYRATLLGSQQVNEEVLFGVANLQVLYMDGTNRQFSAAAAVVDWNDIIAAQVTLTMDPNAIGSVELSEQLGTASFLFALRNRLE